MSKFLLVEDDPKIRANLLFLMRRQGIEMDWVEDGAKAYEMILHSSPELLLLDIALPGMSGLEISRKLAESGKLPPTIVISGEAGIAQAVECLQLGVYDFIEKPFSPERLIRSIENCLGHRRLLEKVGTLESKLRGEKPLLGNSPAMEELNRNFMRIAPTRGRVLIYGESGSGKELVANAIHRNSPRSGKPFIKINCAAIPANLIEDELFGHARGAFTDARNDKSGLFEDANGGTLFLDEIGDMDLSLQSRLLRVLEDGKVCRIGSRKEIQVDVRVIAATHRNLDEMVAAGQFRQDLFFRLNALPIAVPALRDRKQDLPLLTEYFVDGFCRENHMRTKKVAGEVHAYFEQLSWPGNVRELRNLCERLVILGGDPITLEHLPDREEQPAPMASPQEPYWSALMDLPLKDFRKECEKRYILRHLEQAEGNFAEAAKAMGLQRTYLYQKVQSLGIQTG